MKRVFEFIICLLVVMTDCHADERRRHEVSAPSGLFKMIFDCDDVKDWCRVSVERKDGKIYTILKSDMPHPSIKWIDKRTAAIYFSCGNPCGATLYYNAYNGKSDIFPSVIAVDSSRLLVAYIWKNAIEIQNIFDKSNRIRKKNTQVACKIVREWAPLMLELGGGYVIRDAEFRNDGVFHLAYVTGSDYKLVQEDIKIDADGRCLAKQQ